MKIIDGSFKLMRIYLSGGELKEAKPLYKKIVDLCLELDIAGASVLRGIYGYGASKQIHSGRILSLSSDLPIIIEIIDREKNLEELLPKLIELNADIMITFEAASVVYAGRKNQERN
jgi:PII-like signaling protein